MKRDALSAASRRRDIDAVLARFPSYAHTFSAASDVKAGRVLSTEAVPTQDQGDISLRYDLPVDGCEIIMVNDKDAVAYARSVLFRDDVKEIAFDVEWKPMGRIGDFNKCSLLQIACKTHIFLFDLMRLEPKFFSVPATSSSLEVGIVFSQLIADLFTSEGVLKLGTSYLYLTISPRLFSKFLIF